MRETKQVIDVDGIGGDVEKAVARERRRFLKELGLVLLTVRSLPLIANAAAVSPVDQDARTDLLIHSGPGLISHVHDLLIPYALLKAPPVQGVELMTTQALLHRHTVALSREQLIVVGGGGKVTKKASSHTFVISLATR